MSTRGFDPNRDETGEVFIDLEDNGIGEPDTIDDEFAKDDAPDQPDAEDA